MMHIKSSSIIQMQCITQNESKMLKLIVLYMCICIGINANGCKSKHEKKHHGNGEKRIVGGQLTLIGKYPYQVAIQKEVIPNIYYRFTCGGSIIDKRHILTAGHCISKNLRIKYATSSIIDPLARTIDVEEVFRHPDYVEDGGVAYNDIAVLKLKSDIQFSSKAEKIDLPEANSEPKTSSAILTGWGLVVTAIQIPSLWLMKADVPVITNDECTSAWQKIGLNSTIRDTNVCTLETGLLPKTACSGDSGGPLAQDNKVIGVVSWGVNPCEIPDAPSVYTRVSKYVDWIKKQMGNK